MNDESEQTPAEVYETFYVPAMFGPLAEVLVQEANPQPGERVLDVACGTGVVARRIAPRVGPHGAVVAIDLNPVMLAAARALPAPGGATIDWREGDATRLTVPERSFDLVTCQQGLQFFSSRAQALKGLRLALSEGGRLCLAVWRSLDHHPLWRAMAEVEARHLEPLGVTYAELIAPFSLGESEALQGLLDEAGFSSIQMSFHGIAVRFPFEGFVARTERAYAAVIPQFVQDPAAFESFVAGVTEEMDPVLQRFRIGDALQFDMPTQIALAKA